MHLVEAGPLTGLPLRLSTWVWAPCTDVARGCLFKLGWLDPTQQPPAAVEVIEVHGTTLSTAQHVLRLPADTRPAALLWSADAKHIAVCDGSTLRVWDHAAGSQAQQSQGLSVAAAAWSPASQLAAQLVCCRRASERKKSSFFFCGTDAAVLGDSTAVDSPQPLVLARGEHAVLVLGMGVIYLFTVQPGPSLRLAHRMRTGLSLQHPIFSPDGHLVVLSTNEPNGSERRSSSAFLEGRYTQAASHATLKSTLLIAHAHPSLPSGVKLAIAKFPDTLKQLSRPPNIVWAKNSLLLVAFDGLQRTDSGLVGQSGIWCFDLLQRRPLRR